MERSRTPLILLVIALALCLTLSCIAASGGVLLLRILRTAPRNSGVQDVAVTAATTPAQIETAATPAQVQTARTETPEPDNVNRLVVLGGDGNVYTVKPDGSDRITLTTGASESHLFRQPTWSPDGKRVAWTELVSGEEGDQTSVVTSGVDGDTTTRTDMGEFVPFFLSWSPDSAHLACLSNWSDGLALRTVAIAAGTNDVQFVGTGQPFYFAWSPDSQRMLAHISGERLALLSLGGEEEDIGKQPGVFGAPEWSADGEHLAFVERVGEDQHLVIAAPDGQVEQELAATDGLISFSLSGDSRRIAYVETTFHVEMAAFGPLHVVDLETGETERIAEAPVVGFFWSPDGTKLAYLIPADDPELGPRASLAPVAGASHLGLWLQWQVWDGTESVEMASFAPADTFLVEHLRFFDQYSRSMTPWAPDSSAFTFAGMTEDGALGVWVQQAEPGGDLQRAGDGVYSAWSPR